MAEAEMTIKTEYNFEKRVEMWGVNLEKEVAALRAALCAKEKAEGPEDGEDQ